MGRCALHPNPNPGQQASGEGVGQKLLQHQKWQKLAHVFNPESPWGGKMAQLLKVLVTQHEDTSSIPT